MPIIDPAYFSALKDTETDMSHEKSAPFCFSNPMHICAAGVALCSLFLASCDNGASAAGLANSEAAALLKTFQTSHCGQGDVGTADNMARDWLQAAVAGDSRFSVGQTVQETGFGGTFVLGIAQPIAWVDNGVSISGTLKVRQAYSAFFFCPYVPDIIRILDQTAADSTGKLVTVTFNQHNKPSAILAKGALPPVLASQIQNRQSKWDLGQWAPSEGEHTAVFRRLDATGWRVISVR